MMYIEAWFTHDVVVCVCMCVYIMYIFVIFLCIMYVNTIYNIYIGAHFYGVYYDAWT